MKKIFSLLLSALLCICPLLSHTDASTSVSETNITEEVMSAEISPRDSTLPGGSSNI